MAMVTTPTASPLAAAITYDSAAGSTADADIRAGATTLYLVDVDNTANSAATYVKLYDNASPTVGTTDPDFILRIAASKRQVFVLDLAGVSFANLTFAAVTTKGTPGTTSPVSACKVRCLCNP